MLIPLNQLCILIKFNYFYQKVITFLSLLWYNKYIKVNQGINLAKGNNYNDSKN
jgi:hypothetical protein